MPLTKAATIHELPAGKAKQITVNNRQMALFNVEGTFYAIDDVCTHRGASLAEGACKGIEVICPWHGARFDLSTGAALGAPASRPVAAYKVEVSGDDVLVDVP